MPAHQRQFYHDGSVFGTTPNASPKHSCSDVFVPPCWSEKVLSVAFGIDCHDRDVFTWTASPRPITGTDIRTLMDKALWARFGEATLKAPHPIQWLSDNGPQAFGRSSYEGSSRTGVEDDLKNSWSADLQARLCLRSMREDCAQPEFQVGSACGTRRHEPLALARAAE